MAQTDKGGSKPKHTHSQWEHVTKDELFLWVVVCWRHVWVKLNSSAAVINEMTYINCTCILYVHKHKMLTKQHTQNTSMCLKTNQAIMRDNPHVHVHKIYLDTCTCTYWYPSLPRCCATIRCSAVQGSWLCCNIRWKLETKRATPLLTHEGTHWECLAV